MEREAKENVYAVLDPHIQYDITISKHGEPPKYLSLSKPLTHQRTHAFDPRYFADDINNNDKLSTFKPAYRKSDRSNRSKGGNIKKNYVCRSNIDIEYSKDPHFGMVRSTEGKDKINAYARSSRNNVNRRKTDSSSEINFSKLDEDKRKDFVERDLVKANPKRTSNRSGRNVQPHTIAETIQRNNMENIVRRESDEVRHRIDSKDDCMPRPGKVREIASKFDKNSKDYSQSINKGRERPKPIQSYGHQAYLDHVFPDAIEI